MNLLEELSKLEESLWMAETRYDRDYMDKVLHPDFFEFGRSGRIHPRERCMEPGEGEIRAELPLKDLQLHQVSEDTVLLTYVSQVQYDQLEVGNRSSLWVNTPTGWQLRFHQGTPVNS